MISNLFIVQNFRQYAIQSSLIYYKQALEMTGDIWRGKKHTSLSYESPQTVHCLQILILQYMTESTVYFSPKLEIKWHIVEPMADFNSNYTGVDSVNLYPSTNVMLHFNQYSQETGFVILLFLLG